MRYDLNSMARALARNKYIIGNAEEDLVIRSFQSKSGIDRSQQLCITKGFEQTLYGSDLQHSRTDGFIFVCSDKDDRDVVPSNR